MEEVREEENRILDQSGAREIIKRMQVLVNKLIDENEKLNDLMGMADKIKYEENGYGGLTRTLCNISNVDMMITSYTRYGSKEIELLNKKFNDIFANVEKSYFSVAQEIAAKTNAKRCVEYLKELGFDTTTLDKLSTTEVAVPLDKKYLFVCGDNK